MVHTTDVVSSLRTVLSYHVLKLFKKLLLPKGRMKLVLQLIYYPNLKAHITWCSSTDFYGLTTIHMWQKHRAGPFFKGFGH